MPLWKGLLTMIIGLSTAAFSLGLALNGYDQKISWAVFAIGTCLAIRSLFMMAQIWDKL